MMQLHQKKQKKQKAELHDNLKKKIEQYINNKTTWNCRPLLRKTTKII
jgi:hypothetical protein